MRAAGSIEWLVSLNGSNTLVPFESLLISFSHQLAQVSPNLRPRNLIPTIHQLRLPPALTTSTTSTTSHVQARGAEGDAPREAAPEAEAERGLTGALAAVGALGDAGAPTVAADAIGIC